MRTLRMACCAAALALVVAVPARADESNKLTYLTFSAPVDLPGISLPAGRYRFEIADPVDARRVIKVSSDDGRKMYGMLLTIPNTMLEPAKDPVVIFQEVPAGAPHPIKAWFYPGESIGYEFVYPHDQALKIAKANHESVLTSDKNNRVGRVNEADQFAALNDGTAAAASGGTASRRAAPSTASRTTASRTTASNRAAAESSNGSNAPVSVGTSGRSDRSSQSASQSRRQLPRTASPLPWLIVFSGLSLGAGFGVGRLRKAGR